MNEALYVAATGMQAQQLHLEAIAANLANMNTPAYKRQRVDFTEVVLQHTPFPAPVEASAVQPGEALRAGAGGGVRARGTIRQFDPGELKRTDAAMDVAVQGPGFLEVQLADGTSAFVRGGTLKVDRDGLLATQAGHVLKPGISIPDGARAIEFGRDGRVLVRADGRQDATEAGRLELVRFANPEQLQAVGEGLYVATPGSGSALRPTGPEAAGELAQGFVEGSNVRMVDEMVSLMLAQRAYEASVKVIQASDEMLGLVNNLRK